MKKPVKAIEIYVLHNDIIYILNFAYIICIRVQEWYNCFGVHAGFRYQELPKHKESNQFIYIFFEFHYYFFRTQTCSRANTQT